jgi:sugar lactone lactonase YvrE
MSTRRALLLLALAGPTLAATDVTIDGSGIYPESLTSSSDGTLYIGSVKGTIYRALPGSDRAEPWIARDESNRLLSIYGVLADDRSRALWVCSSPARLPGGVARGSARVMRFDQRTAAKTGEWALPAPNAICDDIAVDRMGVAFIDDIASGEILELRPGARSLEIFAQEPALKGIDGITLAQDGTLYVDIITTNQLLRVNRTARGEFTGLTPLHTSQPIGGPDGFRPIAGRRFVLAEARNGRIDEVTVRGDRATIRVLKDGLKSPTAATVVGNTVYAVEGKIEYVIDPTLRGRDPGPFVVRAIPMSRP